MEFETHRFYSPSPEPNRTPKSANCWATWPKTSGRTTSSPAVRAGAAAGDRTQAEANGAALFVLQMVQPGLAGLMDGSVSTLAPLFAAAFATQKVADVPGRPGGLGGRRHQHGLRRSPLRRRQPHRPRASLARAA